MIDVLSCEVTAPFFINMSLKEIIHMVDFIAVPIDPTLHNFFLQCLIKDKKNNARKLYVYPFGKDLLSCFISLFFFHHNLRNKKTTQKKEKVKC